jgi:hypothetical protein
LTTKRDEINVRCADQATPEPAPPARRPFVPPLLRRHEPLTRITLVSGGGFDGGGDAGGTFFGG